MVVVKGFQVQLVDAVTKTPFPEHKIHNIIYVEAEPNAEYFIAVRRVEAIGPDVLLSHYCVDDVDLNYYGIHSKEAVKPSYWGVLSRHNNHSKSLALRFSKPALANDGDGYDGHMGYVEVKLYEGLLEGKTSGNQDFSTDFEPALADAATASAGDTSKGFLMSTKGSITITTPTGPESNNEYINGEFFATIPLHYCSARGLIELDILPKPTDIWELARLEHPAPSGIQSSVPTKKSRFNPPKLVDRIELSDGPEDSPKITKVLVRSKSVLLFDLTGEQHGGGNIAQDDKETDGGAFGKCSIM